MPAGPPEMWLPTTLASLLARSGPKMEMPASPERLMSLETILVPVEDNRADEGAVRDVVGEDLGPGRFDYEHAEFVVREVVARDGGVGALLDKDPTVGVAFDIVP